MYAQVAFPFYRFQTFTYKIPTTLIDKVRNGVCVNAPFRNKSRTGFVMSVSEHSNFSGKVHDVTKISDENLSIPIDLWQTLEWISSYYYAPIGSVLKTAIPLSFKKSSEPQKLSFAKITKTGLNAINNLTRAPAQKAFLEALKNVDDSVSVQSLKLHVSNPISIAKICAEKGYIELIEKKKIHNPLDYILTKKVNKIKLNSEQKSVFSSINDYLKKSKFSSHYIHGETGSGKTEIYIRLVQETLKLGKTAIILVPEISLTPQTASRFKSHLGSDIALWHSKLTTAEKTWTWENIKNGIFKIIIGARSALFTPFKNLGLIVVDEEHDYSFKQEQSIPFYNARDAALVRGKLASACVVLGSATPSMEMYYNGIINKIHWLKLKNRYGNAVPPLIKIIDMKSEVRHFDNPHVTLSRDLINQIEDRLDKNEQIILLQNRRGYAVIQCCHDCGEIANCKNCSVSLTYHRKNKLLLCHYCDFSTNPMSRCHQCGGEHLEFSGSGTQKIEEQLQELFPKSRILRMDFDTVRGKQGHHKILEKFRKKQADILLGTQMIAKGLDFPDVTLVGVINGDTGLFLPDFRAEERNFQLIYQVTGRAGRHEKPGLAIIQTFNPKALSISCAARLDLKRFYNVSLSQRQELNYPPFSRLGRFIITGKQKENVMKTASTFSAIFRSVKNIQILGPSQAPTEKIKNKWRYHLLIKHEKNKPHLIQKILDNYKKSILETPHNGTTVRLDIDPVNIL